MLRFFILLALVHISVIAISQSADQNPLKFDVIPPGPEAVSIGKFVDQPVSAYTGVPNIDIPIYTLKSYELSLPISLSYHASGIKWAEIPSWVGAGWTLNAGGIVSRTIRGRNDEDPLYGYFMTSTVGGYNVASFFSGSTFTSASFNEVYPDCDISTQDEYANLLYASKGGLDLEPDQFFFSLPDGQSGKFIFSRSQQMRLFPHQFATITHTPNVSGKLFDKWMITGKDGTKYFFEKQETTTNNTPCKEQLASSPGDIRDVNAVSSWKLLRIENASGSDYINFEYDAETYSYTTRMSATSYDRVTGEGTPPGNSFCSNNTTVDGWRLSRITTKSGYKVEFVANTNRADLPGSKRLDKIKIFQDTTFLKRFDITYDGAIPVIASVQEFFQKSGNTDKLPSYEFTYYTEVNNAPAHNYSRESESRDHWGYYNAADNPAIFASPVIHNGVYYNGADRQPYLEACQWMTLRQIRYPTGGTVDYEYELNDFSNQPENLNFDHLSQLELIESIEFPVTNTVHTIAYQTKPFTLSGNTPVIVLFEIPEVPGGGIPATGLHATLSKSSGAPFTTVRYESGSNLVYFSPIDNFTAGNYTLYGEFKDGDYALGSQKFYVKIYRVKDTPTLAQAGPLKGGGLRIKKIQSTGDNTYTKTYSYLSSATGKSSGKLLTFPYCAYVQGYNDGQMTVGCTITSSGTMLVRSNAPTVPLSVSQGGHVGYSEVTEYSGDTTTNNGYTVYTFTNMPDVQDGLYPFVPSQSFSYKNGLALTTKIYTAADKLVQETTNNYLYQNDAAGTIQGVKVAQTHSTGCTDCGNANITYHVYSEPTERVLLQSSNTRVYDVLSANYLETTRSFGYNTYDQVTEKSETLSNETQRKKYTRYTYHSTFKTSPVEEYSYYTADIGGPSGFIGGVSRNYLAPGKPTDIYLLENTQASVSQTPAERGLYKHRLHIDYDANGNAIALTKTGDPSVTNYIWDNGGIFPIAQVVNTTTSAKTAFTGFENSSGEGGWTFTLSQDTDKKTGQRSHKLNQSITKSGLISADTSVVSYWAKGVGEPGVTGVIDSNDAPAADADGWRYYEKIVSGVTSVTISGTGSVKIDELRLYPANAQMTTYAYDIKNGLISGTDVNNVTTYYSYNTRKQLEFIRDFENNILKKNEYRYARD